MKSIEIDGKKILIETDAEEIPVTTFTSAMIDGEDVEISVSQKMIKSQ